MAQKQNQPTAGGNTRRVFIRQAATAAVAVAATNLFKTPVYGQNQAPSTGRVIGANDRIVLGFIGVGSQGLLSHLKPIVQSAQQNNVAVAAVCDVSKHRVAEALPTAGGAAKGFEDYRNLLEEKDIDAIFCATVDHWHGRVSVDALNAGKHVYVEKPMTRYLPEAFEVYNTVKKTGKILQVGSQGCSDQKWHEAARLIKEGKIGPIVMSQGSFMRNTPNGEWNQYQLQSWATPDDVNWQAWLGDKIKQRKDFDREDYFRWRKYYQYCAGLLGDLFPHRLHPYMLATGHPEFPLRVAAVGSKKVHTDKNTPDARERDVPEILQLIAEFPSGMVMHITCSTVSEQGTQEMIRGHKGYLLMASNKVDLKPERPFAEEIDPYTSPPFPMESIPVHHKNFFDSIRGSAKPNCGVDLAVRVQTVVSLGEMSERLNVMCLFDEKTRKITTADGKGLEPLSYGVLDPS